MRTIHGNHLTLDEVATIALLALLLLTGFLIAMLAPVMMYDVSTLLR